MPNSNPLRSLVTTSEGLIILFYLVMVSAGMFLGHVDYMEGLGLIGGGGAIWGTLRQWSKVRENDAALIAEEDAKEVAELVLAKLREKG